MNWTKMRAFIISSGGLAWLVGIVILETMHEGSDDSLPPAFLLLAVFAGLSVAWGLWSLARSFDRKTGRIGSRLVGASSGILGVGFGLDLLPGDTWIAFFAAYSVGLFVLPVAFLALGLGVRRSSVFPRWAKWVPLVVTATGTVTYGFHALAPEVWDPSDAVWYSCIGVGWFLLGLASLSIPYGTPDQESAAVGVRFATPR